MDNPKSPIRKSGLKYIYSNKILKPPVVSRSEKPRKTPVSDGIFKDRRLRNDRREIKQQLPRGFRCRRQPAAKLRRMSLVVGGEWYLQTSTLSWNCRN